MASPAAHLPAGDLAPPKADPIAIRACWSPRLVVAAGRRVRRRVGERARAGEGFERLAGVHKLLQKWRHLAYAELGDPGSYFRLLAEAEQIMCTRENPTAGSFDDMQALIRSGWAGRCVPHRSRSSGIRAVAALPTEALAL